MTSAGAGPSHGLCSGSLDLVEDLHAPGGDVVGERRHRPGQERLCLPAAHHGELSRARRTRDLGRFDDHTTDVRTYDRVLADEAIFYLPRGIYRHAIFPEDSVWGIDRGMPKPVRTPQASLPGAAERRLAWSRLALPVPRNMFPARLHSPDVLGTFSRWPPRSDCTLNDLAFSVNL